MTEEEGPRLPIKLRYKQEARAPEEHRQKEAEETFLPESAAKIAKLQSSRPSKIAGTATKTKPRIGSEFQADIPDFTPHSSK